MSRYGCWAAFINDGFCAEDIQLRDSFFFFFFRFNLIFSKFHWNFGTNFKVPFKQLNSGAVGFFRLSFVAVDLPDKYDNRTRVQAGLNYVTTFYVLNFCFVLSFFNLKSIEISGRKVIERKEQPGYAIWWQLQVQLFSNGRVESSRVDRILPKIRRSNPQTNEWWVPCWKSLRKGRVCYLIQFFLTFLAFKRC